jgi:hypothetical protein
MPPTIHDFAPAFLEIKAPFEAEITGVDPVYPPAPFGAWRVTVRWANDCSATFVHVAAREPQVGDIVDIWPPTIGGLKWRAGASG